MVWAFDRVGSRVVFCRVLAVVDRRRRRRRPRRRRRSVVARTFVITCCSVESVTTFFFVDFLLVAFLFVRMMASEGDETWPRLLMWDKLRLAFSG